jgi:hypothetical protein
VHDVVVGPMSEKVLEHERAEHHRRADPAAPVAGVDVELRAERDDLSPGQLGRRPGVPVAQREVGDVVSRLDQALAEIAVPALGPAQREGMETVVDEADAHGERRRLAGEALACRRDRKRATFAVFARS